jgi:hypothetical protein
MQYYNFTWDRATYVGLYEHVFLCFIVQCTWVILRWAIRRKTILHNVHEGPIALGLILHKRGGVAVIKRYSVRLSKGLQFILTEALTFIYSFHTSISFSPFSRVSSHSVLRTTLQENNNEKYRPCYALRYSIDCSKLHFWTSYCFLFHTHRVPSNCISVSWVI